MYDDSRIELKALLSTTDRLLLDQWILSRTSLTSLFEDRIINNLYFETEEYTSAKDNIDGVSKRTKIRYRWYGFEDNKSHINGFLEFKKKQNSLGWKEKFPLKIDKKLLLDYNSLNSFISDSLPLYQQIEFSQYKLPVILNKYNRKYFSTNDEKIRVTIDTSIEAYDQRWANFANQDIKILLPKIIIVEFKFSQNNKNSAIQLLNKFPFRISKHSKYITSLLHV